MNSTFVMPKSIKYVEDRVEYWGPEFAEILGVKYRDEYDQIISMAMYTMMCQIADSFRDGELWEEIITHCERMQ